MDELEPRSFSFNSPYGACPECTGLGTKLEVDPELRSPTTNSLARGRGRALGPAGTSSSEYFHRLLEALAEDSWLRHRDPVARAADLGAKDAVLHGLDYQVHVKYRNRYGRMRILPHRLRGRPSRSCSAVTARPTPTGSRERYEGYMREAPVSHLPGFAGSSPSRLPSRSAAGPSPRYAALPIRECDEFLREVELTDRERQIAERVIKEIHARLGFLLDVGLDYLSLDRPSGTLSGGEAQRIRLATQIGAGLVGVLYVLDEPSIGLHQRDNHRLIETLTRLRDLGNTLIVVEHDEDTIRTADWVVDIGPGAGEHGGQTSSPGRSTELLEQGTR